MKRYFYDGPVMIFGTCVNQHWHGETMAVSPEKARNNLAYQYKKATHRTPDAKVKLSGKICTGE